MITKGHSVKIQKGNNPNSKGYFRSILTKLKNKSRKHQADPQVTQQSIKTFFFSLKEDSKIQIFNNITSKVSSTPFRNYWACKEIKNVIYNQEKENVNRNRRRNEEVMSFKDFKISSCKYLKYLKENMNNGERNGRCENKPQMEPLKLNNIFEISKPIGWPM